MYQKKRLPGRGSQEIPLFRVLSRFTLQRCENLVEDLREVNRNQNILPEGLGILTDCRGDSSRD